MNLSALTEPSRDETTFTHQGRWRRSGQQQAPLITHQAADPEVTWADSPQSLSLCRHVSADTALRQQFQYVFLNGHLPAELLDKTRPKFYIPMDWFFQLQDVVIQSPALESSIGTYLAARVGRKHNDMNLVHRSRSMYVASLDRVQRALCNSQTRLSDETLAACMVLSLYELTEHPMGGQSAFSVHNNGAMMLLRLRGPDACASPLGHGLFLQLRVQTVSPSFPALQNALLAFTK